MGVGTWTLLAQQEVLLHHLRRDVSHGGLCPDYLKERTFFWDVDYTHNFVTTERRCRQLFNDNGFVVERLVRSIDVDLLEAGEDLLVNAAHECGYHTGYGIITSEEWKAVVQPMIEKVPEDILYGAFAVFTAWGTYIASETPTTSLQPVPAPAAAYQESHDIDGATVVIAIQQNR